jgi:dihydrofolate synthase/folylpolyglutamate synthase
MTKAEWPARMQRLKSGALVDLAEDCELWLDGGHNPAAGAALASLLSSLPKRPTHLICGMLNTKDVTGYMAPLAKQVESLTAISIPGENATLTAEETAKAAASVGISSQTAESIQAAIKSVTERDLSCRILICGSVYLAGHVLRGNG